MSTGYARQRNEMVLRATAPEALLVKCVKCPFQPVSWPDWIESYAKMEAFVRMVAAPLARIITLGFNRSEWTNQLTRNFRWL